MNNNVFICVGFYRMKENVGISFISGISLHNFGFVNVFRILEWNRSCIKRETSFSAIIGPIPMSVVLSS